MLLIEISEHTEKADEYIQLDFRSKVKANEAVGMDDNCLGMGLN